jgi:hypothetical protein
MAISYIPDQFTGARIKFGPVDADGYTPIVAYIPPPPAPLKIPPLGQRDPRWKQHPLGVSNDTIGADGCLLTCLGMAIGVTPDILDEAMVSVGAFAVNRVRTFYLENAFAKLELAGIPVRRIRFASVAGNYPADVPADVLTKLAAHLKAGKIAIIEVDSDTRTPELNEHYVLATGVDANGRIIINDPWFADTATLTPRYRETNSLAIYRIIYFDWA